MSNLSDEKLLKRAGHAGTSVLVLACLATLLMLVLGGATVLAKPPVAWFYLTLAILLALLAAGYWFLAVAAKRGDPTAVGLIMVLLVTNIALALLAEGVAAARSGGTLDLKLGGLIIPVLVLAVLAGNRRVLIELRDRGIWNLAFPHAKPTNELVAVGGFLLVAGMIGLNAATFYTGSKAVQAKTIEAEQARAFVNLIKTDEQEVLAAFKGIKTTGGAGEAVRQLNSLEAHLEVIASKSQDHPAMASVVATYKRALSMWRSGLTEMQSVHPDREKAMRFFRMGDQLRQQAFDEFDRRFAKKTK